MSIKKLIWLFFCCVLTDIVLEVIIIYGQYSMLDGKYMRYFDITNIKKVRDATNIEWCYGTEYRNQIRCWKPCGIRV